jgi:hypothetical protein
LSFAGDSGAGIGPSVHESCDTVRILNGTYTAQGDEGPAIGASGSDTESSFLSNLIIDGGYLTWNLRATGEPGSDQDALATEVLLLIYF